MRSSADNAPGALHKSSSAFARYGALSDVHPNRPWLKPGRLVKGNHESTGRRDASTKGPRLYPEISGIPKPVSRMSTGLCRKAARCSMAPFLLGGNGGPSSSRRAQEQRGLPLGDGRPGRLLPTCELLEGVGVLAHAAARDAEGPGDLTHVEVAAGIHADGVGCDEVPRGLPVGAAPVEEQVALEV